MAGDSSPDRGDSSKSSEEKSSSENSKSSEEKSSSENSKSSEAERDDLWYERIFDEYEKLGTEEEMSDQGSESDEPEEMSDQGSESDESEEKAEGDEEEVYYGAIESAIDEDEEENNPDEVYHTTYDEHMDLQQYLNDIVFSPGDFYLKSSAVIGCDGIYLYWTPAFPNVNPGEILEIWNAFDLGGNRELDIAGERHMMIEVEPSLMLGGSVAIIRTHNTLVFGLSHDPIIPHQCIERVKNMAEFMKQRGM